MSSLEGVGKTLAQGLAERVFTTTQSPALAQDSQLAQILSQNQSAFMEFAKAHSSLVHLQQQQMQLKQQDISRAEQTGALQSVLADRSGPTDLDLVWRQLEQAGRIEASRLQHQRQLAEQEQHLRAQLQQQSLQVRMWQQQELLKAQQQHQAIQIQSDWHRMTLATIFSPETLKNLPLDRLQFVSAVMQVSESCPLYFRNDLGRTAKSQMRMFKKHLRMQHQDLDFYSHFFQDENVFDANIEQLRLIVPHHCVIAGFSSVVQDNAYFHYTLWGSESAKLLDHQFDQEVCWSLWIEALQKEAAQQGQVLDENRLIAIAGGGLIGLQKLFACYLVDLYALVDGVSPVTTLTIDHLDLGPLVEPLVLPQRQALRHELDQLQKARLAAFETAMRQAQKQQREHQARLQAAQQQAAERMREEARQRQLAAEQARLQQEEYARLQAAKQQAAERMREELQRRQLAEEEEKRRREQVARLQAAAQKQLADRRRAEEEQRRKAEAERQGWNLDAVPLRTETTGRSGPIVDYSRLRDLLKAQQWAAADQETVRVMLQVTNRLEEGWLQPEDLLQFPCADLVTLDQLWIHGSWGYYGFSVQKKLYLGSGAKLDGNYPGHRLWFEFCKTVGWVVASPGGSASRAVPGSGQSVSGYFPLLTGCFGMWERCVSGGNRGWLPPIVLRLTQCGL